MENTSKSLRINPLTVSNFSDVIPPFLIPQGEGIDWLALAHALTEEKSVTSEIGDRAEFFRKLIQRFGCRPPAIEQRGTWLSDYTHRRWSEMLIHRLEESSQGRPIGSRMQFFDRTTQEIVKSLVLPWLKEKDVAIGELIHVTCTGYVAPSAVQRWAAENAPQCLVTHAYHMGCYAAIPALRMASGSLSLGGEKKAVGICHTELCSLHLNPAVHTPEQLVVQSLFADGAIAYQVRNSEETGLRILALEERLIPRCSEAMTWIVNDWGMSMTLDRDVPAILGSACEEFVDFLLRCSGKISLPREKIWFAIHPGGPRIIESLEKILKIESRQTEFSREVLSERGNMSSATLPYVWRKMLNSDRVVSGDTIVSLAFGPGLTMAGAVFEKQVCPSL